MPKGKLISGINPSDILNWTLYSKTENIYPPAAADVNGEYYLISGFEKTADEYYAVEANSIAEALEMSAAFHGKKNIVELANIYEICLKLNINPALISVFEQSGIKGRKSFEILGDAAQYPDALKKYLCVKDIPLKTLGVFNRLNDVCQKYIIDTITEKELSTGDFRNLVNILFDMMPMIKTEDLSGDVLKKLSAAKDAKRQAFLAEFARLTAELPLTAESPDNFETGRLVFSFAAESADDFLRTIQSAESKISAVENTYRFLDEQNIS